MRRSTAAAVGTLAGAALIVGVRLSVQAPEVPVAGDQVDVAATAEPEPESTGSAGKAAGKKPAGNSDETEEAAPPEDEGKFKNGTYQGSSKYVYGTIEVSVKVTGGKISSVKAGYPTSNDSGTINPPAVAKLKQGTLKSQSAEVDAISGATLTTEAYGKSMQAALDKAAK